MDLVEVSLVVGCNVVYACLLEKLLNFDIPVEIEGLEAFLNRVQLRFRQTHLSQRRLVATTSTTHGKAQHSCLAMSHAKQRALALRCAGLGSSQASMKYIAPPPVVQMQTVLRQSLAYLDRGVCD